MKTLILIISTLALGLMGVGCAKSTYNTKNSSNTGNTISGSNTNLPGAEDIEAGSTTDTTIVDGSGSTVTFTPASLSVFNQYVSTANSMVALNNPQNIKININLNHVEAARYGGNVTISYTDNGMYRSGVFYAGTGRNPTYKNMYDNNKLESEYNYWFNWQGQKVFTGFFEDQYGAITVTLTPVVTGGGNDAEPLNIKYKGAIYFKNFSVAKSTPYRSCWHIYNGPNDCRSNVIQTKCGLAPGAETGYTLLGTFTNVNIRQAFNIN